MEQLYEVKFNSYTLTQFRWVSKWGWCQPGCNFANLHLSLTESIKFYLLVFFSWILFVILDLIHGSWSYLPYASILDGDGTHTIEGGVVELYGRIQKAVEISTSNGCNKGCITIMIDDISLLEIAAHGSANHILNFVHYCRTLTTEMVSQLQNQ